MLYLQEVYPKVQLPYKRNYAYISDNYNVIDGNYLLLGQFKGTGTPMYVLLGTKSKF